MAEWKRRLVSIIERLLGYKTETDALEIVKYFPDIVYHIDRNGKFIFINDAVKQLGYKPEELIGKHFRELIHPDDIGRVSRSYVLPRFKGEKTGDENAPGLFDERRTRERGTRNLEVRLVHKDYHTSPGLVEIVSDISASGHFVPSVTHEGKEFRGTIGVIRDITGKKRIEEQYHLMQRMAFFGVLAGGIRHDLNNILSSVNGYLQLAMEEKDELVLKRYLNEADNGLKRLSDFVGTFKTLSEGRELKRNDIDLYDAARNTFDLFAEYENVDKIIDLNPGEVYVFAVKSDIEEILLNLTKNSLESDADLIRVAAKDYIAGHYDRRLLLEGEYVDITFEDNGKGMSIDVRKRAFDPYFSTKIQPTEKSHGLGLTMVFLAVLRNQGYIEIDPAVAEGTRLHLYLPKSNVK